MQDTLIGLVVKTDGSMFFGQVPKGLQSIYQTIGCEGIEGIRLKDAIMYIDDEGKFKPEPKMNKVASILAWNGGLNPQDWIAGDAVIFGTLSPDGDYDGEDYDLPPVYKEVFEKFSTLTPNALNFMVEMYRESVV
jgi:hypothetical protein